MAKVFDRWVELVQHVDQFVFVVVEKIEGNKGQGIRGGGIVEMENSNVGWFKKSIACGKDSSWLSFNLE